MIVELDVRELFERRNIVHYLTIDLEKIAKLSTTSIMDRQLLHQTVCQKISVIKTNTCAFVVFKTKHELECQNEQFL